MIAKKVIYSGTVQGVGFRQTVVHLAGGFAVAGYVKNLADGSVELVAEGDADEVDRFLERLGRRMAGYIAASRVEELPPTGKIGFHIAY